MALCSDNWKYNKSSRKRRETRGRWVKDHTPNIEMVSGEATGGLGSLNPPLASRTTPGIRTKAQRNFFGRR
jgi:hypothetical protein